MEKWIELQLFAEKAEEEEPENQGSEGKDPKDGDEPSGTGEPLTAEQVQKMIQSETDKVRTEYSKRLKDVEAEKKKIEDEKLSTEEKLKLEQERKEKALAEKEQELTTKELKLRSYDVMKEHKVPEELQEVLLAAVSDEEELNSRGELIGKAFSEAVEKAVSERLKDYGRSPEASDDRPPRDPSEMSMEEYADWYRKQQEKSKDI